MSNMSSMEKLLDGVEVEWKALRDVAKIQRGKRLVKRQLEESGNYAVYQNSMTPLGYYHESNVKSDTAFIISAGAAGEIGYSDVDFWAADDVYFFLAQDGLESKFLYYFLLTQQNKISAQVRRASIPRLSKIVVEKLQIPIPCPDNPIKSLEVQAEIVHILDAFTELTAELTAELTTRKKQYNYYRDQLLTFAEDEVEWKTLGGICHVASGGTPSKAKNEYWNNGNVPWLKSESCKNESVHSANNYITNLGLKNSSAKLLDKDTTLIALVGATIFKTAFLEFEAATNQNIASIKSKDSKRLMDKFVFYYITSLYDILKFKMREYGMLNLTNLRKFKIPIPYPNDPEKSLEEQKRIVTILDQFETLINSISEGLPREIELRQKQYEYYRDLLLSFPKSKTEAQHE